VSYERGTPVILTLSSAGERAPGEAGRALAGGERGCREHLRQRQQSGGEPHFMMIRLLMLIPMRVLNPLCLALFLPVSSPLQYADSSAHVDDRA